MDEKKPSSLAVARSVVRLVTILIALVAGLHGCIQQREARQQPCPADAREHVCQECGQPRHDTDRHREAHGKEDAR